MKSLTWYLKQLLPLRYSTKYKTPDGVKHNAVWRMWMGKCFVVRHS